MITAQVTFEVFSDQDGTMPPDRLTAMFEQADHLQGQLSAPLEYIPPTDKQTWGLRIVVADEEEQP